MNAKRILMCAAALSCALLFQATASAAVESPIVGYTTIEMEAGKWYMLGMPFADLEDGDIKLNEHFVSGFNQGDILQVYDSGKGYTGYRYKTGLTGEKSEGWCTARGTTPVDISLAPGQAPFIQKNSAATVTLAGKVDLAAAYEFGSETGNVWNQLSSPSCDKVKLNDLKWTGVAAGDALLIYVSTKGYTGYRYKTGLTGEKTEGWCTAFGKTPVDVDLAAGASFFVNKKSAGKGLVAVP